MADEHGTSPMYITSGVARLWSQGGHRGSGGRELWGTEVPSGVQWQSPGEGLGQSPRSQIYTNNLQLSNAFLRRFVAESILHLSLPPKKPFGSARIPWPNTAGSGWAHAQLPTHHTQVTQDVSSTPTSVLCHNMMLRHIPHLRHQSLQTKVRPANHKCYRYKAMYLDSYTRIFSIVLYYWLLSRYCKVPKSAKNDFGHVLLSRALTLSSVVYISNWWKIFL